MVISLHPAGNSQARTEPVPGLHPAGNFDRCVKSFLIAGEVEGKTPGTLYNYRQQLKVFRDFLFHDRDCVNLDEISRDDVRLFLLSIKNREVSAHTVRTYHKNLKAFFNWFVTEELLAESPMLHIKPNKLPKKIITPLSSDDISNILLLCSGTRFKNLRDRAIVLMFLDTALRLEELASIRMNDIDIETGIIKVMGKGSKERYVRIGKHTQRAVLRYLLKRDNGSDSLWVTDSGAPFRRGGVQTMIDVLLRRASVSSTKRGPHILRHTAAITFLRNGGDVFSLQIMLGHSTLEMTRKYVSSLGASDMIVAHQKASPVDNFYK